MPTSLPASNSDAHPFALIPTRRLETWLPQRLHRLIDLVSKGIILFADTVDTALSLKRGYPPSSLFSAAQQSISTITTTSRIVILVVETSARIHHGPSVGPSPSPRAIPFSGATAAHPCKDSAHESNGKGKSKERGGNQGQRRERLFEVPCKSPAFDTKQSCPTSL